MLSSLRENGVKWRLNLFGKWLFRRSYLYRGLLENSFTFVWSNGRGFIRLRSQPRSPEIRFIGLGVKLNAFVRRDEEEWSTTLTRGACENRYRYCFLPSSLFNRIRKFLREAIFIPRKESLFVKLIPKIFFFFFLFFGEMIANF